MTTEDQKSREEFEALMQAAMYYGIAHTGGGGRSAKDPEILAMRRESCEKLRASIEALQQASRRTYRASVLEEAAQACEDIADEYGDREGGKWPELKSDAQSGAKACENALRALAAKTQEGQET